MVPPTSDILVSASRHPADRLLPIGGSTTFWAFKRGLDVVGGVLALPMVAVIGLILCCINPIWNPGPLLYNQQRMGRELTVITVTKFRTMRPAASIDRGPADPLEVDRITPLGGWLRRLRLDELPQLLSVIRGDMSLVGPRPDYIVHAESYLRVVPGYGLRHAVRPGISGYAQVTMGYAEGIELAAQKTSLDTFYIRNAGWRLEAEVLISTLRVLASGFGAR